MKLSLCYSTAVFVLSCWSFAQQPEIVTTLSLVDEQTMTSDIEQVTQVGDYIYFVARDGRYGKELMVSDGSLENTEMSADFYPGFSSSTPDLWPKSENLCPLPPSYPTKAVCV